MSRLLIDFASEVSETVEGQLWQAMRGLEESNLLLLEIGKHFKEIGRAGDAEAFLRRAKEVKERAQIVHDSVLRQKLISGDLKFDRRKNTDRGRVRYAKRKRKTPSHG